MAGCLERIGLADATRTGFPQLKLVRVAWDSLEGQIETNLINARSDSESWASVDVPESIKSSAERVDAITISDDLDDQLERSFTDVRYLLGSCWTDDGELSCRNQRVSRSDFNRVQFGDRIEVSIGDTRTRVVSVENGEYGNPTESERPYHGIQVYSFSQRYEQWDPPRLTDD